MLNHHEIGIYVEARVPDRFARREVFHGVELAGTEHEFALEFRWFGLDELGVVDVRPRSLVPALTAHLAAARSSREA